MSLGKWVLDEYGVPFILLYQDHTLGEIQREMAAKGLAPNNTFVIYHNNTWRAARFNRILNRPIDNFVDPVLLDLKTDALPLTLVDAVIPINTDETSDDVVDRLLMFAQQVFIVVDEQEQPIGVLANTELDDSDPEPVFFTAFYGRPIAAEREALLLVYAHLENMWDEIEKDSNSGHYTTHLGESRARPRRVRASREIKRGTPLTLIPEVEADYAQWIAFKQSSLTLCWDYDWEVFPFYFTLHQDAVGQIIPIHLSVQIADLEVAGINIVLEAVENTEEAPPLTSATTSIYQKIFISYSRKDTDVVRRYYQAQIAAANDVFLDVESIRSGVSWRETVKEALDEVDFMQLFWSESSAASTKVQFEWEYFLKNRCKDNYCEGRLRPVYWDQPLPPVPSELRGINFRYVPFM